MGRFERIWYLSRCSPEPNYVRGLGGGGAEVEDYPSVDGNARHGGDAGWRVCCLFDLSTHHVRNILAQLRRRFNVLMVMRLIMKVSD